MPSIFNGSTSTSPDLREHSIAFPHNGEESSGFLQSGPLAPGLPPDDMSKDKERPRLEILLDNENVFLKGTGVDVEPARLSGHVALYLSESISVKEITLQFRGKARLPVSPHESISINGAPITYIVCNHEWSFLEGEKRHSHTLKAGRHFFPFQLQLGGSLPSTVSTTVFGGASVAYKLRAHVTRPGLSHNLQSQMPVNIIRSFAPEALEYQQTLEIENTWPEKLMYSIMIPHKAWACGDTLTAIVKFSPLLKGVGVLNINTSIHETVKVHTRSSHPEHTRIVASVKHEISAGKAIEVPDHRRVVRTPGAHSSPGTPDLGGAPRSPGSATGYFAFSTHEGQSSEPGPSSLPSSSTSTSQPEPCLVRDPVDGFEMSQDDIVTFITFKLPLTISPTHVLEPIHITHRIRWSILILNPDGHTSELRCSLPVHILDPQLMSEARMHTAATRRLLIGGPEVPAEEVEDDMELPSYTAHVRDRVANMYLPESATMRVTNPWVRDGASGSGNIVSPWSSSRSGYSSPLEAHALSYLPHAPGSGDSTPLDWINSELLLTLQPEGDQTSDGNSAHTPRTPSSEASPDHSNPSSRPNSRPTSAYVSRRSSRAPSPERGGHVNPKSLHVAGPNETYIHNANAASRNVQGVFRATMKPFTSITHPTWLGSRSHSHSNISSLSSSSHSSSHPPTPGGGRTIQLTDHSGRAYTEVPGYQIASRGFIGGVPPLTSMRGLPSYEDSQIGTRTRSDSDLASRLANVSLSTSLPSTALS
jgi:arrestin-related trafficking adapter 4/5/7